MSIHRFNLPSHAAIVHEKVGISNIALALPSIHFPRLIPLLHGNQIDAVNKVGTRFNILHPENRFTQIYPIPLKSNAHLTSGFIFKKSTTNLYPVPMENTILLLRLHVVSHTFAYLHLWLVSQGIYTKAQKRRQLLFLKSLLKDFADNAQRSLGVRACPNRPTVSGLCNNQHNTKSGVTLHELLKPFSHQRLQTEEMAAFRPNSRRVSDEIFKATTTTTAPKKTNLLMIYFGQFIDHEIAFTPSEHIDVEAQAPILHRQSTKGIQFTRSGILRYPYSRCCRLNYLKTRVWQGTPFNALTSFIDGGTIYGSDNLRAVSLRSYQRGKLVLQSRHGELLLPFNQPGDVPFQLENEPTKDDRNLFVAGDLRANENPLLLSIHTLFVREHNRVCKLLRRWLLRRRLTYLLTDEWLYNNAKQIVIAELQSITFNEFIPMMLGNGALRKYNGYKPKVDARISTFHSTFAFRWGHSGISERMQIKYKTGKLVWLSLKDMFFNSNIVLNHGIDNIFKAQIDQTADDIDEQLVDSLRDFLFNPSERAILDLAALNIQRSRDLGIPGYVKLQDHYQTGTGLDNIKPHLRQKLLTVYGYPERIDAFVGGLSERKMPGSLLGPLFSVINAEQFRRIRDGDRFYYENIKWHPAIKHMPIVLNIRRHKIRFHHILYANSLLRPSCFGKRQSLFQTA